MRDAGRQKRHRPALLPAEIMGLATHSAALVLLLIDWRFAVMPLVVFLAACLLAPFFPRIGFLLPSISRGTSGQHAVALTFDDGPDWPSTPELLNLLARYNLTATFFVTGERAARYPHLVRDIVRHGHAVGNHSHSHDLFLMLKGRNAIRREVNDAQQVFRSLGIRPLAFRPPVGIANPLLGIVLDEVGLYNVNFSCRAADMGNRRLTHLSRNILARVKPDDIIMLHDIVPRDPYRFSRWLAEVDRVLAGLQEKNFRVLPLAELIGRDVMVTV